MQTKTLESMVPGAKKEETPGVATVAFQEDTDVFYVRIWKDVSPRTVSVVLSEPVMRLPAGDAAARLIVTWATFYSPVKLVAKVADERTDLLYHLTFDPTRGGVTRILVLKGRLKLFDGEKRADFVRWAEGEHELTGRLVKFYYEGGTVPGNRVVRVDSVTRGVSGHLVIRGKDLRKDEHRSFSEEKIRGDVIVID
jgi:hypothetical protein